MMLGPRLSKKDLSLLDAESFANENMICFEEIYQNYCVGIVDIVNSTSIVSRLSQDEACVFYSVFLNTIGFIAQSHGAKVVKNIGDGILFYFPKETIDNLSSALKCSLKMIDASKMINEIFTKRKIPKIQYRISLDYGPVMIAKCNTLSCKDIFGPTVNLCAKINRMAKPDGIVIGSDMYQIVKKSKPHTFLEVDDLRSSLKQNYPVYAVKN